MSKADDFNINQSEFEFVLDNALDAVVGVDDKNKVFFWNKNAERIFGWPQSEIIGKDMTDLIIPERFRNNHRAGMRRFVETGVAKIQNQRIEIPGLHREHGEFLMELTVSSVKSGDGYRFYSFMRNINAQKKAEEELKRENRAFDHRKNAFELALTGAPLESVLTELIKMLETQIGADVIASVLLADEDGKRLLHGAAPGLPKDYNDAINGILVGADVGSCGTAAFLCRTTVVTDVATDPLWAKFKDLALKHGLAACWSAPIISSYRKILGTFAVYSRHPKTPARRELEILEIAAQTAALILDRQFEARERRQSEEQLKVALQAGRMGTWSIDLTTNRAWTSQETKVIFGVEDFAEDFFEIINSRMHHEDSAEVARVLRSAVENRKPYRHEYRIVLPSTNEVRWILSQGQARYAEDGTPLEIAGVIIDITERVLADEQIKASQAQFESLANAIPQLAWMADESGHIFWYNERWYKYTGTTFAEMEGWGWEKVHNPDLLPRVLPIWKKALETGEPWEDVFQLKSKTGEFRWFLSRAQPIKNAEGKIVRWFGTNTDIHEVREAQEKLRLALEGAQLGTWTLTLPNNVLTGDQRFKRMHGIVSKEEDITAATGERIHPDDMVKIQAAITNALEAHTPYICEYRMKTGNDQFRWIYARGEAQYSESGQPISLSGVSLDVDDRKNIEMQLLAAKEEAERANELKSAFLANMSHEIRTPLGAMLGFADLLKEPGLSTEERSNYIDILSRNGSSLAIIINDILDLSKVEAGHLILEYTDTNPHQVATDVVSLLRVKAKEKDLILEYTHDEDAPKSVVADPTRVRQILVNLVGNAIKFTQFGKVKIRSYGCSMPSGAWGICFDISDTGIGIPASQREKVFEMFVQADGSMTRRFGGTGLGLALSRRLAREMGGDVSISATEEGVGTTFLVQIQDQPDKRNTTVEDIVKDEKIPLRDNSLQGLKILVVDDSPDNQQLIWRYLTRHGAITESAENGLIGYRAALSGDFDVVLMDIQMPIMDGYSATQKLRDAGYRPPIIALTAHAMSEIRKKALNVGYSDHLTKPINPTQLVHAILKQVSTTQL